MSVSAPLVHVGYPKALSSWLQRHLFQPERGFYTALDPVRLQLELIQPGPFSFKLGQLQDWMREAAAPHADNHDLIPVVTSESLVGNPFGGGYNAAANADRLHRLCGGDARIVLICREQASAIRSLYKTLVYWGMPHSIERLLSPVDRHLIPQFSLEFLRYDGLVAYYQSLFGRERVLVLPFEQFSRQPYRFLQRLCEFAGMAPADGRLDGLPVRRVVNYNKPLSRILWQRWCNRWFLASPFNYSGLLASTPARLQQRLAKSGRSAPATPLDPWLERRFRDRVEACIKGEFSHSNHRLAELSGLDLKRYGYQW